MWTETEQMSYRVEDKKKADILKTNLEEMNHEKIRRMAIRREQE